jgi:WD40 repeat protein/mono/diheme cytochrome c family protein
MSKMGWLVEVWGLLLAAGLAVADEGPSYARQVRVFFAKYCVRCHHPQDPKGGLDLTTYEELMLGGNSGEVISSGKPDESKLVLMVEGKLQPKMPPKEARQPDPREVALLRSWVAAGAKDDTAAAGNEPVIPEVLPRTTWPAAVSDLAITPDGKVLIVAASRDVVFVDLASGNLLGRLSPLPSRVSRIDLSPDGKLLAVAYGEPSRFGRVALYRVDSLPLYDPLGPERTIDAHRDVVYELRFSPEGHRLATCSYDKLVRLWDPATGQEIATLKDHSDGVYGLAWSPDGKLLATAAADRAVKIWDTETKTRLYSLTEATDWLYAAAWHPKKNWVAAAGVDKSIRVWEVDRQGGKVVHSVFAHDGPVTRLEYTPDGRFLLSAGEDGVVKIWDAERMVEEQVLREPEHVFALVSFPQSDVLAVGRYDGHLALHRLPNGELTRSWSTLDLVQKPLPQPPAPVVDQLEPRAVSRGQAVRVTTRGKHLQWVDRVALQGEGLVAEDLQHRRPEELSFLLRALSAAEPGLHKLKLEGRGGSSDEQTVAVLPFASVSEQEPNDSRWVAQAVPLGSSIRGTLEKAGDTDFYRVSLQQGQELGVQLWSRELNFATEPRLLIRDAEGQTLARSCTGLLGFRAPQAGDYYLEVHDAEYRGGADRGYYVSLGDLPVVVEVFPLGIAAGSSNQVRVEGVYLGGPHRVQVRAPDVASEGTRVPVELGRAVLNPPRLAVGRFPDYLESQDSSLPKEAPVVRPPVTINGRIENQGDVDYYRFQAQKGSRWVVEVEASELGSELDSVVAVLDTEGKPIPRAVLRCLAQTYTTFNDRDSRTPGFRIEAWSELAVNDYVYVGEELLRVVALPRNPDDDIQLFSFAGQRICFLDTTPSFKPVGTPVYKVSIHPPHTVFPPNGMPTFTIYYQNDDAGPPYRRDSRLSFEAPLDGTYVVAISDSRGEGGPGYGYRLTIRPPEPKFEISAAPTNPSVWKGGSVPIQLTCRRVDGFLGEVRIHFENVPDGLRLPETVILPETYEMSVPLYAGPEAVALPANQPPIQVVATAKADGQILTQRFPLGVPRVVDPGELVTSVEADQLTIQPGSIARLKVSVERRQGFHGRVPLEVRGLPHGVRVLDVGLNGILITERETERVVRFYAEPWVRPQEHWFGIYALREGKGTLHGSVPVLLRVKAPGTPVAQQAP